MLQGEVNCEQAKQPLFCSLEHNPHQPLQVRQPRSNNTLCAQQLQGQLNQRDRAVAFHGMRKQLTSEPQVLSPPTRTQLVGSPDLIQVLIYCVVTVAIAGKSGGSHLHLVCNRWQDTSRDACPILQGPSGET